MSATQSPGSSEDVLIFIAPIILLPLRRTYRTHVGVRFSQTRTIVYACFYVGIGLAFSVASFYEGVSYLFSPLYAVVLVAAAVASYRFSDRRITFWRGGDGSVYFKGGVIIYMIYLAALVVRLGIDYVALGPEVFNFNTTLVLTGGALDAAIVVDLLLMFGVGLLVGRNARVLRRYRRIERGEDPLPEEPPAASLFQLTSPQNLGSF